MEISEKKKALKMICLREHRGGRRAAAYWFDFVFISLAVLAALYLCVRPQFKNRVAAEALTVVCGIIVLCIYRIIDGELYDRRVKRLREEVRKDAALNRMLMNSGEVFSRIAEGGGVFCVKSLEAITADDIRPMLTPDGGGITVVSFAKPTDAARRLIEASGMEVKFIAPHEYLKLEPLDLFPVSDAETDGAIIRKYGRYLKKPHISRAVLTLTRERAAKFLAVGAGLMLFSFFMRYSLYYRLMASLSLSVGAYVFAAEELKKRAQKKPEP